MVKYFCDSCGVNMDKDTNPNPVLKRVVERNNHTFTYTVSAKVDNVAYGCICLDCQLAAFTAKEQDDENA